MQITTFIGILIGILAIFGSHALDGLNLEILLQPTALSIVLGGTIAALMVNYSFKTLLTSFGSLKDLFHHDLVAPDIVADQIVKIAEYTRREGVLALQDIEQYISHPFLGRGLQLVVDNTKISTLKDILSKEIERDYEDSVRSAEILESAGEYAPTFGIIGAVLGLIQVMQNLNDSANLGYGVATAFVSTVYGILLANLFFIPLGGKIKEIAFKRLILKQVILEGLLSLQNGEHPALIEEKLISIIGYANMPTNLPYYNTYEQAADL